MKERCSVCSSPVMHGSEEKSREEGKLVQTPRLIFMSAIAFLYG